MLLDLRDSSSGKQETLFVAHNREQSDNLMNVLDPLNAKYGKNIVKLAVQGLNEGAWALRCNYRSPRYLSRIDEFIKLKSGKMMR